MLPVSGAFHSPLVEPAVAVMRGELAQAQLTAPNCKFVANVTANLSNDPEKIRENLARQIVSCVQWSASVEKMAAEGANQFIEVGSGKVLTGLLKRINKELAGINFGEPGDLDKVRETLAG
jgi:[acyl-carrier-protein] S-malonyltransferase